MVPDRWVGLLGLVPLALGVRGLVAAIRAGADDEPPPMATGILAVSGLTIANGANNVSVYTPLFRTSGVGASLVIGAVFTVLVAVWCLAGSWLGGHARVIALMKRYGRWIVPGVFVLIGAAIVLESNVIGRLL